MFNCKNYLQIKGCAVETVCTPIYANIFMARSEEKHVLQGKVELHLKYIDAIFFIWKGIELELKNSFNETNKEQPSIKFNQNDSELKIEFLNVLAYKGEQQRLQTTLFKKIADTQAYPHPKSDHPVLLKKYSIHSNAAWQKNLLSTHQIGAHL